MKSIFVSLAITLSVAQASWANPLDLQRSTNVNQISAEFLASRLRQEGLSNKMVSGVSLFYALSILESGAAGRSEALLNSYLLQPESAELTSSAAALVEQLISLPGDYEGVGSFEINSTIWSTNGETNNKPFVFNSMFERDVLNFYNAPAKRLDFMAPGASGVVNDWANTATRGLIPEVINDGMLKQLEWLIASAAYFEGSWATSMREIEPNTNYQFKLLDGSTRQTDTIATRNYRSPVLDLEDGSVAFHLPFIGGKYSFVAYLPSDSEKDLNHWLTESAPTELPEVVSGVLENNTHGYELYVQLPAFSFSDEVTLTQNSQTTSDLDLGLLFSDQADFEPMIDRTLSLPANKETKVGIIKQDTRIELDEGGVKAAAVTLIGGVIKSTRPEPRLPYRSIIVDRPFVFAIVENSSQTVLFSGILVEPEQV